MTPLSGVTMIELMVVLAILALLTVLAAPSFNQVVASTRVSTATNELYGSLNLAKSEAIRTGSRVTVCPTTDLSTCLTSASATWSTGWLVFSDATRTASFASIDAGESIIQIAQDVNDQIRILGSTPYASFAADGTAKLINGGLYQGRIRVCSTSSSLSNNARARDITILRSGRIEISTPSGVLATCPAPSAPT